MRGYHHNRGWSENVRLLRRIPVCESGASGLVPGGIDPKFSKLLCPVFPFPFRILYIYVDPCAPEPP